MSVRNHFFKTTPETGKKFFEVQKHVEATSGLGPKLIELVRMRVSQINGCAFCIDMHGKAALKLGETAERLLALSAWRLFNVFTPQERAALEFAEAVTLVHDGQVPDDVYERTRAHFSEEEMVNLGWVLFLINGWNRMSITFRLEPGSL